MPGTPNASCSPSNCAADEALLDEIAEHRQAHTSEADYMEYCAELCRSGRLRSGRVRALAWRDAVLGRAKATPVPLLGDGVIKQYREETRSQATASGDSHSRENTNVTESFDSTVSRPTPRTAEEPTIDPSEPVPPLSARSEGEHSECSEALANSAESTPAATPAFLHRRQRHRSVDPRRPLHTSPLNNAAVDEEEGHALPTTAPLMRRRAKSLSTRGATGDASRLSDAWQPEHDRGGVTSSTELSGSVRQPMAWYHLPENCQPRVVEADIERSLWKLYTKPDERVQRRRCLKNTLLRVLLNNLDRYYYQGLHELMGFVMYMLSPHMAMEEVVSVCEALLTTRWRQFSARRLTNSEAMLYAVHAIIAQEDPPLAAALEWCGVGPESHYAVSWVITWYVHSVEDVAVLTRLFDFFIADATGTAVMYFTAAFVISQRKTIFEWIHAAKEETGASADAPEATEDGIVLMARVYAQLSRLPSSVLHTMDGDELEALLRRAEDFSTQYGSVVEAEEQNFLRGDVKKLGMLSNANTRNAALRLLWHFLPREWRNPAEVERVRRFMFWTSVMVAATAMVVGTAAIDAKQGRWVRSLFH